MTFSLFPRIIYRTQSKISGPIKVKEQLGQHTLHIQGLIQSGGLIKSIWRRALKRVNKLRVAKILVLGLGGGTVVHLIKQTWPDAEIMAIEIDSVIIQVARKYFGLNKVKDLQIIQADAFKWVADHEEFDLIIIDLYLGKKFPKKGASGPFLKNISRLLAQNGVAIFNRLRIDKTTRFEAKLRNHFSQLEQVKTASNHFFLARR